MKVLKKKSIALIIFVSFIFIQGITLVTNASIVNSKPSEKMQELVDIYNLEDGKINPILVKKYKSYLDWILLVYLYEKNNTNDLIELNKIEPSQVINKKQEEIQENDKNKTIELLDKKEIQKDFLKDIKNKIEYEYKNKLAITIPTKSSVTKLKQMKEKQIGVDIQSLDFDEIEIQSDIQAERSITFEKPKFLQEEKEEKITSAQKGTLVHLCMQKLNPKEQYDLQKIKELIQDLQLKQIITEKEADSINPYKILEFTKSKIWGQLKAAKEIYKEKPFYINIPAKEIYEQEIEEDILVQGIIDLYYIDKDDNLVLVDYKTDYVEKVNENQLVEKYKTQLELYKKALEEALHRKVK